MKWTKYILETTTEAVDFISDMLYDLGIEGIEICDKIPITEEERKQLFIDFLPELGPDDGLAEVSFYVEPQEDTTSLLLEIQARLKELSEYVDIGSGRISISETEDKDWINNWKQFFKPFRIDENLIIKPTWEKLTDYKEDDLIIEMDPGTSFGTGSHETTKLCILGLKKYLQSDSMILDAGSGSGILSIIAIKLGADKVLGVDIDTNATNSALENAIVNQLKAINLDEQFNEASKAINNPTLSDIMEAYDVGFITGNIIEDDGIRTHLGKKKYDLVVANILADVIIPLSKVISENLKAGGIFISSGIINTKEAAVRDALEKNDFEILEVNRMNDWVSFVARCK